MGTTNQERDLIWLKAWYDHQDYKARDQLILAYRNMVFARAKYYAYRTKADLGDFVSEAWIALVWLVNNRKYRIDSPVSFALYAHCALGGRLLRKVDKVHRRRKNDVLEKELSHSSRIGLYETNLVEVQDHAGLSFANAFVPKINKELSAIFSEHFVRDMSQHEIGKSRGFTHRTIGNRIKKAVVELKNSAPEMSYEEKLAWCRSILKQCA